MRSKPAPWIPLVLWALLGACGGSGDSTAAPGGLTAQESQCVAAGWTRASLAAAGLDRPVLWRAPAGGAWTQGAILVLHGGGGSYTNFCVANVPLIAAQVRFTEQALAAGFAVFLLDSTDAVTDDAGRLCGKVWDDEVHVRPSLDLPYVEAVVDRLLPSLRPAGSRAEAFLVGHSSGAYMTVRAATRMADRIAAFAPVAGGDPYGWYRDCTPRPSDRVNVFGAGFDRETHRQIIEPGACTAATYAREMPWDDVAPGRRPPFRVFHHAQDGINDRSCVDKVRAQLVAHGYPELPPFTLDGGSRSAAVHYWLDEYNAPLLAFLAAQRR